jgi:polyisoprenoid-binding protein YceI
VDVAVTGRVPVTPSGDAARRRITKRDQGAVKLMDTPILTVAPAGTWNLDPVHSRVDFEVGYLAGTFKGEFHEIAAELAVEGGRASLEGAATVASVDVKDENLSAHLQSPDFFDAERHPELRFAARDIRLDGDGKVSADGELTIKGVSKPVTVSGTATAPIADPYGNDRVGLNLAAKIDRTNFGVDWNNPLPSGDPALANDVTILAELQFVKPGGETSQ